MTVPFLAFDHVQLGMPEGSEADARAFYVEACGMTELPKPEELAKRGGAWFGSVRRAFVFDPFGNRIELIAA